MEDELEADAVAVRSRAQARIRAAHTALKSFHPNLVDCDLLRFLCISDHIPEKSQSAKGQPQPPAKKNTADGFVVPGMFILVSALHLVLTPLLANVLATLPPPHVRVRRNEGLWDILPPALPFWEHLGLAPASGRKNLMAFCIYPGGDDVKSQVSLFIDYLGASYESCKLGAHIRSDEKKTNPLNIEDGLISVTLSEHDDPFETSVRRLREVCVDVGKHLSTVDWQRKKLATSASEELPHIDNFIIYMVNPYPDGRGIAELCAAFWLLYKSYGTAARSPQFPGPKPDLVLQIISISDVASPRAPVIHESIYFQKLARQVYDRSPPSPSSIDPDPSRLRISSAASIQLEQSFPKKIMFQLTSEPPSDLLHDNSHLHVAYAVSKNGEWVTAAWTCSTGRYQASVSYCLVGGRTFFEVAREIWNATMEIMQARRVAWRLCVVKVGLMGREELDGMH
jgi:mediator of RNA polymerase II transcription subunit 13